mmetsp:Transcript_71617/g.191135  ORF Transcript_71617/g.191135 Transcript_71617/m.191135 type:complete len:92 (+) Transcript_71617:105-380(+)
MQALQAMPAIAGCLNFLYEVGLQEVQAQLKQLLLQQGLTQKSPVQAAVAAELASTLWGHTSEQAVLRHQTIRHPLQTRVHLDEQELHWVAN